LIYNTTFARHKESS